MRENPWDHNFECIYCDEQGEHADDCPWVLSHIFEENKMITDADLDKWFMYHAPKPEQLPKYLNIRAAGKLLAKAIMDNTPSNADQTAAIRKVREAIMTANASIACEE